MPPGPLFLVPCDPVVRGYVYESEWVVDGGGRGLARHVGEIAQGLERWLAWQGYHVPVRTAVMLMQENARLVEYVDPVVDFVGVNGQD